MAVVYDMSRIDAMEGHEFERFIADLLRKLSYQKVEVTPGSGDQGVDVLAEKDGVRYAIQCKCYSSDLGNTPVQEVNTGKMIYHCHVGVVVTNRYFTQSAREAAKATGVLLWDRSKLESLISQVQVTTDADSTMHQSGDSFTLWTGSPLLRRGGIALRDKDWKKAAQFFDRVLNTDPENAEAYLGLVMAEAELSDTDDFMQIYINEPFRLNQNNLRHTKEFAGKELIAWFIHGDEQAEKVKKETESRLASKRESIKRTKSIISCGLSCSIGLRSDGTAVAIGVNGDGECNVSDWIDIVAVGAGNSHTVGLKSDGTVVAVGNNKYGQCDVSDWIDIVAVEAGDWHTVGLKSDGTVVAEGYNEYGQCDVSDWIDIVAVEAGDSHTIGLKSDGTVVAVGNNKYGQCNVSDWTNIVMIAGGGGKTIGLKSDGTVVGPYYVDVSGWTNIVMIASGAGCAIGLKSDGTVVAEGVDKYGECNVSGWRDIVAIRACLHTVGLKSDGTVVATGFNMSGQCDVQDWKLFNSLDTIEQERSEAKARREAEAEAEHKRQEAKAEEERKRKQVEAEAEHRRQEEERAKRRDVLEVEQATLQMELANLKGLFTGRRRREIEARLKVIEQELANLTTSWKDIC